jgi:DNA-binding MarR family transcriptional regulator
MGAVVASDSTKAASLYSKNWPTDSMGWAVAYCSRRLQEGLTKSFAKAGYKVSPEQWSIVTQLWEEDGLTQQALADRFHRSKVAAFHLITKLEEQGLVVRSSNPDDRRSKLIHLTPTGRAMVARLIPFAESNLERATEGIAPAELESARTVLGRMADNMTEQREQHGRGKEDTRRTESEDSISVQVTPC